MNGFIIEENFVVRVEGDIFGDGVVREQKELLDHLKAKPLPPQIQHPDELTQILFFILGILIFKILVGRMGRQGL